MCAMDTSGFDVAVAIANELLDDQEEEWRRQETLRRITHRLNGVQAVQRQPEYPRVSLSLSH